MGTKQVELFNGGDAADQPTGGTPAPIPVGLAFSYRGFDFAFDDRRFINLTAMWKATGSPANKDPREWRRQEGKGFIADLARSLNVGLTHIIVGDRGRGGATHAHWQISIAYAKYLSHEFHRVVNEAFRRQVEEEANPGLKIDRGVRRAKQLGWSDDKVKARVEGILQRNLFTEQLKEHGVRGVGYARCSDAINEPVLGSTAKKFKERVGLPPSAKTRDHLEAPTLVALNFAESVAGELMALHAAKGNDRCENVCGRAGEAVANLRASLGLPETRKKG
jgi:hypothetical protein